MMALELGDIAFLAGSINDPETKKRLAQLVEAQQALDAERRKLEELIGENRAVLAQLRTEREAIENTRTEAATLKADADAKFDHAAEAQALVRQQQQTFDESRVTVERQHTDREAAVKAAEVALAGRQGDLAAREKIVQQKETEIVPKHAALLRKLAHLDKLNDIA